MRLESLHSRWSFDTENSSPETAEKTGFGDKNSISDISQKEKGKKYRGSTQGELPDIAGVRTPSPITIQVPSITTTSNATCKFLCFSSQLLIVDLFLASGGLSSI